MRSPRTKSSTKKTFANHEVVVVAAYLAGSKTAYTDTEEIAVKANEIAPGRFTWRKYKEQINIETVRKRLWDATKTEKGGYLIGAERFFRVDDYVVGASRRTKIERNIAAFATDPLLGEATRRIAELVRSK
jgi:hypothetical protein